MLYSHTQKGTLIQWLVGLFALFTAVITIIAGLQQAVVALVPGFVLVVLIAALFLFGSLTVEVTETHVALRFGIGWIRKSFRNSEIASAQAVRNRWYYGWGIRWIPGGWLFNVSGLDAVEIVMADGRRYRIGSDQPRELLAAIDSAPGRGV